MKVTVTLTIDVDVDNWRDEYGPEGASAIRGDVKRYVLNHVQSSNAAEVGAIHEVSVR